MTFEEKTKIALDDSRMLMMGAQILFGFQLQVPFQEAFDRLPTSLREADLGALLLMVIVIGLLIAPSAYHRLVEEGEATEELNRLISRVAILTPVPFSLALALSIAMAGPRIGSQLSGSVLAAAAFGIAMFFFYVPGLVRRARSKETRMPIRKTDETPLSKKIEYVLTEARVVLPGAQALLGFQLIIIFSRPFDTLPPHAKAAHTAALFAVTLATILLLAPAAYHRLAFNGEESEEFQGTSSRLVLAATVVLAVGIGLDVAVVAEMITSSISWGVALGTCATASLIVVWIIVPAVWKIMRKNRSGAVRYERA